MTLRSLSRTTITKVMAILMVVLSVTGAALYATASEAQADSNRDRLRPGCEWDPYNWWVQYCQVYSPAMGRNIPVHVKAGIGGSDAGLYLLDGLHGFNKGASGWIWSGHVAQAFEHDNITLVAPAAGDASFYTDWAANAITADGIKTQKWETFLTQELPAYLQKEFGVSPTRNAIAGLSMGATAAMSLGARHRDQFQHITALSGYYQTSNPVVATGLDSLQLAAGVYNPYAMWGAPVPATPARMSYDPTNNISKLKGMPMYISSADGVPSLFSDPSILDKPVDQLPDTAWRSVMESVSRASTHRFEHDIRAAGIDSATFVYSSNGIHSWDLWTRDTALARPYILKALGLA